jgi:two-component system, response regulator RegA
MTGAIPATIFRARRAASKGYPTSYPSIRTAADAIKLGAIDYLAKPASADEVVLAPYRDRGDDRVPVSKRPMSGHRAAWEHISRVPHANDGNISATARALAIDRRTLQRKLRKRPEVRE